MVPAHSAPHTQQQDGWWGQALAPPSPQPSACPDHRVQPPPSDAEPEVIQHGAVPTPAHTPRMGCRVWWESLWNCAEGFLALGSLVTIFPGESSGRLVTGRPFRFMRGFRQGC